MTAPEMVDVVAEVLRSHAEQYWNQETRDVCCGCDHVIGRIPNSCFHEHAAHQARAVLAALTEAGTVEWGTVGDREGSVIYEWSSEESARYYAERHDGSRVISRLRFPWTAAE